MNWGKSIILAFIFFALFIGMLVTVCVRQEINLVSKNYYEEELDYQSQIERLNNTARLTAKPIITVSNGSLRIENPTAVKWSQGELKLFRPSDVRFDKRFPVDSLLVGDKFFDVHDFPKGMYRARLQWLMEGKEYYMEEIINL